jgi:hypothetical protein
MKPRGFDCVASVSTASPRVQAFFPTSEAMLRLSMDMPGLFYILLNADDGFGPADHESSALDYTRFEDPVRLVKPFRRTNQRHRTPGREHIVHTATLPVGRRPRVDFSPNAAVEFPHSGCRSEAHTWMRTNAVNVGPTIRRSERTTGRCAQRVTRND